MSDHNVEDLCRTIVEKSSDAIIYADGEGIIRLWNSGATGIFGYSHDEAVGRSLDIIVPEGMRDRHWEGYRKVMGTGETKYGAETLSVPAIRKDGSRISIEFTIVLISGEEGNPKGTAAIIRDVTKRWEKEREMKKRLSELEERVKSTGHS